MEKVLYEEMVPEEYLLRIKEMPVAFLPLGTLEWHGPHMPLGADGIQSRELFVRIAQEMGGVVLPMLFSGPDRFFEDGETVFYGMDINTGGTVVDYPVQKLPGSAYWMDTELFRKLLMSIIRQLARAGVRVLFGHGHGPSTNVFISLRQAALEEYGVRLYTAWSFAEEERLKFQNDHAGANETSIVMALRPDLIQFERVREDGSNLIGIAGKHPVKESSAAYGREITEYTVRRVIDGLHAELPELFA